MTGQALTLAGRVLPLDEAGGVTAERAGPKAATLARLRRAGLPVPDGFCLAADAYRDHLTAAGLADVAGRVARVSEHEAGRLALSVRLGLLEAPLNTSTIESLDRAYSRLVLKNGPLVAVRSSALHEGTTVTSYAGQLETMLGVAGPDDLMTAVRACWASLWSPRALRYMRTRDVDPSRNAVAVFVQQLVRARVAGGALSTTSEDRIVLTAAWGLGSAVAEGEVVPDRYVLRRDGPVLESAEPGDKHRMMTYSEESGSHWQAVPADLANARCLDEREAVALARLVLKAEAVVGTPVEVEWALGDQGFELLQARTIVVEPRRPEDHLLRNQSGLKGQPSGSGRAVGPARVVRAEAELERVRLGDILVTLVPGPALAAVLPRVAGVVAELGGSTSHLAALARERGLPAVLGLRDATRLIPDGSLVLVDGDAGVVHVTPSPPPSPPLGRGQR